jgi:hypothetical protein
MAVEYLCKICRGHLNVKTSMVLSAHKANGSERGLIFLNPEIGNYTITTHTSFPIMEGKAYIFTYPICHFDVKQCQGPTPCQSHFNR